MRNQREDAAPAIAAKHTTMAPPRRHTPETFLALVGAVEVPTVIAYVNGFPQGELIDRGARISTARVVDEGAPIAGVAAEFMVGATKAQRRLLATVTPTFLSSLATGLHTATGLDATMSRRRARATTKRKAAKVAASAAMPEVRTRRELFCTHLLAMASGDAVWIGRIRDACGAAPDGAALAASIDDMIVAGRALAADAKSRGVEVSVDAAYFDEMKGYAEKVRAAHDETRERSNDSAAQAELDWWDGANLWFLTALVDNFEQARKIDRTIPKLALGALANTLKPKRKAAKRTPKSPAKPSPNDPPA